MSAKEHTIDVKWLEKRLPGIKDRPTLLRALGCIAHFLLGLMMSTALVFNSLAPFGIGLMAQAGAGLGGLMALLGAITGYFISGGLAWGIKYVATVTLVFTASFVFQELKVYKTSWFMPLVAAAIALLTSFLNTFDAARTMPAAILVITETMLAAGSAYFFGIALSDEERTSEVSELRHGISIMILLGCMLMSLSNIVTVADISMGRVLAVMLVMTVSLKSGLTSGAAAGAAIGLAMDIAAGGTPFYTMAYAFSGLLAGVFSRNGRFPFVVCYIAANAIAVIWTWNGALRASALYEVFVASVLFMILPSTFINQVGGLLRQTPAGRGETGLRKYSARRLQLIGDAFSELHDTVHRTLEPSATDEDVAAVFDRAADSVCIGCKLKNDCWQQDYLDTLNIMNDASASMIDRGKLVRDDLPERFLEKCQHSYAFISAVNSELRGMMYRRQFRSRLDENRSAAYEQYADIAHILKDASDELKRAEGADALAERRLLRWLAGEDIDATASVFRDGSSRMRVIIESARLTALTKRENYLDELSGVLGVRLCRPGTQDMRDNSLVLLEAEPLAVSVGIAAMKKKGEPVSGDRGTYFKTDRGTLCVILSDGMGSGPDAAKESVCVVDILERFLRSGVEPSTAMRMLNSVMLLKNGEKWGYATVDLMCVNLFTGEAVFYKYGAAPSYVRNGKSVRRVRGEALAAGLCIDGGAAPDAVHMKLRPGSIAIIASDGVVPDEEDLWLRGVLGKHDGGDTKTLARAVLQKAVKEYGCQDDMTVLAVQVDSRT